MSHNNRFFNYVLTCCANMTEAIKSLEKKHSEGHTHVSSGEFNNGVVPTAKEALEMLSNAIENYECPFEQIDEEWCNGRSLQDLAAWMKAVKTEADIVGSDKTMLQKKYDFLSISVIPELMDESGIQTMKITDVGRLQVASDINCSVPAANKDLVRDWLVTNGHESLVQETINSSTFKAFIKERMKEQKEYPATLIKVTPYSRATIVKG